MSFVTIFFLTTLTKIKKKKPSRRIIVNMKYVLKRGRLQLSGHVKFGVFSAL